MSLRDEYEAQVLKGMLEIDKMLFPPQRQAEFDRIAQEDIKAGKNKCRRCPEKTTMQCLWPYGTWICDDCARTMWKTGGWPAGVMVFDMSDRPEGWTP